MEIEPNWAKENATFVFNAIMHPVLSYPQEFDDKERENIEKAAKQLSRVAYLEAIGALGVNPLPEIIDTLLTFHTERLEEGANDTRFMDAADSLIENQRLYYDIARSAVIDSKGRFVDQEETLLALFSDEEDSDQEFAGTELLSFDRSEEILLNRLFHELGIKRRFSYEDTFGYVMERQQLGREPLIIDEGRTGIETKYNGITAWFRIDSQDITKIHVGLSFDYRIKRLLANIKVMNVGVDSDDSAN